MYDIFNLTFTRFQLTRAERDAWYRGITSSSGSLGNLPSYSQVHVYSHLGEVTPVDCAKRCLAARTNSVDSCNAFTILDGVCTVGNIQSIQPSGDHFKYS